MLAPRDLDRLLDECVELNARLSTGARRTLRRFLRLRQRHGERTIQFLSADDIELLEDWAATPRPVADTRDAERERAPAIWRPALAAPKRASPAAPTRESRTSQ